MTEPIQERRFSNGVTEATLKAHEQRFDALEARLGGIEKQQRTTVELLHEIREGFAFWQGKVVVLAGAVGLAGGAVGWYLKGAGIL